MATIDRPKEWWLAKARAEGDSEVGVGKPVSTCNRHDDCDAADARARAKGHLSAEHCHDECCDECFGN